MNDNNMNDGLDTPDTPKSDFEESIMDDDRMASESSKKSEKRKGFRLSVVSIICALAFVVIYAIINKDGISAFFSNIISVLSPIILGCAFAYILNPLLKIYESKVFGKIRNRAALRGISIFMTYITAAAVIFAILFLIVPQLIERGTELVANFGINIDHTLALIEELINDFFTNYDVPAEISQEQLLSAVSQFFNFSGDVFEFIKNYIIEYGMGFVVGVKNVLLGIFISVYMLISKERLKAQVNKGSTALLSPKQKATFYRYAKICNKTFAGFFIGKIVDSLIIGVITYVTLLIFKVPHALIVSSIVCVTNVIPVFGPFIGAIPSFFIIFIVDPGKALLFLLLILLIQQLDGNVIGPKILGNTTGLSSLGVIIAIIIMGEYFGIIGMILGVPIFAVILTMIKEFIETRLRKKHLPINTAEYYSPESTADPYYEHETLSHKFFMAVGLLFSKIFNLIFKSGKKNKSPTERKEESKNDSE